MILFTLEKILYALHLFHRAAGPWETGLSLWGLPPLLHIFKTVGEWPYCMMDKVHSGTCSYLPNIYSPCHELGAPLGNSSSQNIQGQRHTNVQIQSQTDATLTPQHTQTHSPRLHIHMYTLARYWAQWIWLPQYPGASKPRAFRSHNGAKSIVQSLVLNIMGNWQKNKNHFPI